MKKILFIEDEEDQIMMVKTRLEACGYAVVTAVDGEEGIKKTHEEKPDLILLDIVMPKVNGYEVCDRLKKDPRTRGIPIIVVTASGVKNLEEKCLALGVEEIIRKPYESAYLAERIAFHLGE
jgi:CheY-like chemotaxis protein